jgi:hypothetical protein
MRKSLSIIFSFIFLFNIGGYYLCYRLMQFGIREGIEQQIKNGLKTEELSLVVTSINNESGISWIEKNKEFSYQGEMYDIVKTKIQGQSRYYYCINDHKEKQLIANYLKTHNSRKESEKKIKNSTNDRYFPQDDSSGSAMCPTDIQYTTLNISLLSNFPAIPYPPPKTV